MIMTCRLLCHSSPKSCMCANQLNIYHGVREMVNALAIRAIQCFWLEVFTSIGGAAIAFCATYMEDRDAA